MSYILDAIKKAERERNPGQLPTLQTLVATAHPAATQTTLPYAWITMALLLVCISLLSFNIWQWSPQLEQFSPMPSTTANVISNPLHTELPLLNTPMQTSLPSNPPVIVEDKLERHSPPTALTQPQNPPASPASELVASHKQTASPPMVVAISAQPTAPQISSELATALPQPEVATQLPLFNQSATKLPRPLPSLTLNVHVYADNPQQRFVLLNGKRYIESMQIASELYLRQIRPEDIVIEYQQQRFRLLRPGL